MAILIKPEIRTSLVIRKYEYSGLIDFANHYLINAMKGVVIRK